MAAASSSPNHTTPIEQRTPFLTFTVLSAPETPHKVNGTEIYFYQARSRGGIPFILACPHVYKAGVTYILPPYGEHEDFILGDKNPDKVLYTPHRPETAAVPVHKGPISLTIESCRIEQRENCQSVTIINGQIMFPDPFAGKYVTICSYIPYIEIRDKLETAKKNETTATLVLESCAFKPEGRGECFAAFDPRHPLETPGTIAFKNQAYVSMRATAEATQRPCNPTFDWERVMEGIAGSPSTGSPVTALIQKTPKPPLP